MPIRISELDVLIATIIWLVKNDWDIEVISVATGYRLLPIELQKEKIKAALNATNYPFNDKLFKHRGSDIIARSQKDIWKIECKGLGSGGRETQRTNFDRAVASTVSYFDTPSTRLGLALANDYLWFYNFQVRLPMALRESINLWVLLLENGTIYPYEPTDELPFPGVINLMD